ARSAQPAAAARRLGTARIVDLPIPRPYLLPTAAATQPLDFLEQVERERGSGQIDLELALQANHALNSCHGNAGEAPVRALGTRRLDDALGDDFDHELLGHTAGRADLCQRELGALVEQQCTDLIVHVEPSNASRGFRRMAAAICRYRASSAGVLAAGVTIFRITS